MAYDILIVDDETDIRMLVSGILEDEGYQTREAGTSAEAVEAIESRPPGLVLLDIWLENSDLDGIGILEVIKRDYPDVPVVMMSGHGTVETAVQAIKLGAYDFIEKPFKSDRLLLIVERAIEAARLRRENEELKVRAGEDNDLIGDSHAIRDVRQAIERVAPTNSRVLITGPAGSGKEVAARMLHKLSRRADGPFVVINCANMEPDRFEMELFGTEHPIDGVDGGRKIGTFERAHNGALFLDEVADMPMETQGKIVRVLQDQTFERIGGGVRVSVDVRVIAASTRDLSEEMASGRLREDLFYRLSVVPISMPSLRERRDDIPKLAESFMRRAADANGRQPRGFGADAMATLQGYDWPGNVRELRNVVERLLIMAPGDADVPMGADMLPTELTSAGPAVAQANKSGEMLAMPLREAREVFERDYLVAQIDRFGGNISKTASYVGMERSALHRKLKSLGVGGEDKPAKGGR